MRSPASGHQTPPLTICVDRCEQERDLSWAVNATAPATLAKLCAEKNIQLVHYGTDYVFDGKKITLSGIRRAQPVEPLRRGQAGGEQAVLAASPHHLILRTSWVFRWHPNQTKTADPHHF